MLKTSKKIARFLPLLFLQIGCTKAEPGSYPYQFRLDLPLDNAFISNGASLVVQGKVVGSFEGGRAVTLDLPKETQVNSSSFQAAVRYDSSCGPLDIPLRSKMDQSTERSRRESIHKHGGSGPIDVDVEATSTPPQTVLLVDNRNGSKAAKVSVGSLTQDVAARGMWRGPIRLGSCPNALEVKVDGNVVGNATAAPTPKLDGGTLVDVVGGTCYTNTAVWYTVDPKAARGSTARPPQIKFGGARVYKVEPLPGHFLDPAPSTIRTAAVAAETYELLQVPCSGTKAP